MYLIDNNNKKNNNCYDNSSSFTNRHYYRLNNKNENAYDEKDNNFESNNNNKFRYQYDDSYNNNNNNNNNNIDKYNMTNYSKNYYGVNSCNNSTCTYIFLILLNDLLLITTPDENKLEVSYHPIRLKDIVECGFNNQSR